MTHESADKSVDGAFEVVALYRGGNEYLRSVVKEMRNQGIAVSVSELAVELSDNDAIGRVALQTLQQLGTLDSREPILVDKTINSSFSSPLWAGIVGSPVFNNVQNIQQSRFVDAYEALNEKLLQVKQYVGVLKAVADELRKQGKVPVLLEQGIADHMSDIKPCDFLEGLSDGAKSRVDQTEMVLKRDRPQGSRQRDQYKRYNASAKLASIFKEHLNIDHIVGVSVFDPRQITDDAKKGVGAEEVMTNALKNVGLVPSDVVLLSDHHIYELTAYGFEDKLIVETGLSGIEVLPVCTCCIGKETSSLTKVKGFRVRHVDIESVQQEKLHEARKDTVNRVVSDIKSRLDKSFQ